MISVIGGAIILIIYLSLWAVWCSPTVFPPTAFLLDITR